MRKLFCYLVFVSAFISGCSSAPKFNESLVRPWKTELNKESPSKKPFIAHFKRGSYELYYLAAHHANDPKSETHYLLNELFQRFRPKFLVVEPIPNSEGESPDWFLRESKKGMKKNIVVGGESSVAAVLADERKIPFAGGEIEHREIYEKLRRHGFSQEDVLGFYLVRQIPQWVRQKESGKDLIDIKAPPFIAHYCKTFGIETGVCPSVSKIKDWYRSDSGKNLGSSIDPEEVAPIDGSPLFTHRISSAIGSIRDRYTLMLIERYLLKYQQVAVVYGRSHYLTLRDGIEAGMGRVVAHVLPTVER